MKKLLTQTLAAAAIGGAMLSATPANAASLSIGVGFPGVSFSYNSGGYCDAWGCPDRFWNYPVYYCPVYYGGRWYSGPAYYRQSRGGYQYWIRGGWRRDSWNRPRPRGACVDRYGPPLDLDFYIWNGFNVRDQWRYAWRNQRNDWWNHRQTWDRSNRGDTSWQSWVPTPQRNYDWNRQRDWNSDREWTRPDWNRADWERQHNIQRGGNVPPAPPVTPFGGRSPTINRGGAVTPPPPTAPAITPPAPPVTPIGGRNRTIKRGGAVTPPPPTAPTITPPTSNNPPADLGGRKGDGRKGGKDNLGAGGSPGGAVTPPPPTAPAVTPPATNNPPADKKEDRRKRKDGKDNQEPDPNSPQ